MQRHAAGYRSTYMLFKSLTAAEVEEYMKTANDATVNETPMDNIEVWHPVCRLQLMLKLAQSLSAQGVL